MTAPFNQTSVSGFVLAGCLGALALAGQPRAQAVDADRARPQSAALPAVAGTILFDIPAQPLGLALNQFASVSGWPILFQKALVDGRISSAVSGMHAPAAALLRLLEGTGLAPERVVSGPADTYVLREDATLPAAGKRAAVDFDYGAWVQARMLDALCGNAMTAPGAYRMLLRFRIDPDGKLHELRVFSSSGNPRRDAAITTSLRRLQIDRAPPPTMQQPLTMLLAPVEPGGHSHCDNARVMDAAGGAG